MRAPGPFFVPFARRGEEKPPEQVRGVINNCLRNKSGVTCWLNQPENFLCSLLGKAVVLHKAAHFGGVDSRVFRKGAANPVTDVVVVFLRAGEAELPEQRPVGAVLVLDLEYDGAAAHPDVGVADPRTYLVAESRQAESQVAQDARGQDVDRIAPGAGLDELLEEVQVLAAEHFLVAEEVVASGILDFTIRLRPHVFDPGY